MKHRFINMLVFLLVICFNTSNISARQYKNDNEQIKKEIPSHPLFHDKGSSTFEIISGNNDTDFYYKIVETNYNTAFLGLPDSDDWIHYIAKYITTTSSCTGCEGQVRDIKVELRSFGHPENIALTIDKKCDKIELNYSNYKTITYGCCGSENELEIFDYHQRSIIKADNEIILGSIPNSRIKFYTGCKQPIDDPHCLSILTIAYNNTDQYIIRIKSEKQTEGRYMFTFYA